MRLLASHGLVALDESSTMRPAGCSPRLPKSREQRRRPPFRAITDHEGGVP
jgi:hypothetical protein